MPLETFMSFRKMAYEIHPTQRISQTLFQQNQQYFCILQVKKYLIKRSKKNSNILTMPFLMYFHKVFSFLLYLRTEIINLSTKDDALHPQIVKDTKYFLNPKTVQARQIINIFLLMYHTDSATYQSGIIIKCTRSMYNRYIVLLYIYRLGKFNKFHLTRLE